jgi:hypothetical protein
MLGYVDKEQHEYRVNRQIDFKSIMSGTTTTFLAPSSELGQETVQ